ncbi:MAG: tetratricopeptide repeat protein [Gammaproteobacteria bacterium]|nr:tetratricopeptide repeat protein [Gammaproteobacteria bacterium]MCP5202072.1 tetratricopeptide repeat protein [Gammaproteobacteria bacterium]
MKWIARPSSLLLVVLLQACASGGVRAPIESRGEASAPAVAAPPAAPTPSPPLVPGVRALPDAPRPAAEPLPDEIPEGKQLALAKPAEAPVPRDAATSSLLAAAMQAASRNDWDRAQAALERAVKLAPQDADLWRQLAYTHYRRGDQEQALQTAQRALSLPGAAAEQARTWALIADIQTARGDADAAAAARARATP